MKYYRRIRTTNEKRQNIGAINDPDVQEHGVKIRAARAYTLVDAWEDLQADLFRNWKKYRLNQYRA